VPQDDVQTLYRVLVYATPESRRRLAGRLVDGKHARVWDLLAMTARSGGDRVLRARCVEVLGLAAAGAREQEAELILNALLG
jgi:hypothetical protein